jgi:hypothetical protein
LFAIQNIYKLLILFIFTSQLISCGGSKSGSSASSSIAPVAYCTNIVSYTNAVNITGTAQYLYRSNGNGAITGPKPIRYAEIRVTDASGAIIQCGETDSLGQFNLSLPKSDSTANIYVTSRADNDFLKAYVLTNPTNNTFHSISSSVTLNADQSVGTLLAPANATLEGGAFNILDKILDANIYLKNETTGCSISFADCTPFTVAPLVTAYWTKGVNPGSYYNLPPLSFYLPGERKLFLLGGVNGDVDSSDTDHFDNTIIIHEYGHFIEDIYSKTDSPGGSHSGNTILDPRLAWGEAWANFFQAMVTGNSIYRDTFGTPDGTAGVYFNENLESGSIDTPITLGDGNFREFSITRALVDYFDSSNEGIGIDRLTAPFAEFWTLFTSSTSGFTSTSLSFRSVGLLYELQNVLVGKSNWSEIQTAEKHKNGFDDFGNSLTLGGACAAINIQAANISGSQPENGTPSNSNQFASNDFYQYTHAGGSFTLSLTYTTNSATPADLDIYLYKNKYTFGSASSVLGFSDDTILVGQSGDTETFTIDNLAAGTYMINVNVNTDLRLGSAANYSFSINGQNACPN